MFIELEPGLDPRCYSPTKLAAPKPLPYVSRRQLQKVRHRIKPPVTCHRCNWLDVVLVENSEVYGGRSFGLWPYVYLCRSCGAYVSLHPKTDLPTGVMADDETRKARQVAKMPFKTLERVMFKNQRGAAYQWLSTAADIPLEFTHFSMFDEETSHRVMHICYDQLFYLP
jgi:hypothetical protein